ncbi:flagellar hook-basal body complex protein FliE [Novosphingobium sp. THN1]|uniref:flagellar hook-basal body complex protein FliE n=1 Tax=Novosphingobium sp. THN1 TaxID=1016987 RepID=UPI0035137D26
MAGDERLRHRRPGFRHPGHHGPAAADHGALAAAPASQGARGNAGAQGPQAGSGPAGSFTESLKGALDNVNASQQKASAISEAYEKGEVVDVAKVMLARQEAGVAFEATLQVRNKLLNAYQDIMRMGV